VIGVLGVFVALPGGRSTARPERTVREAGA
jgi:hypothetical protein